MRLCLFILFYYENKWKLLIFTLKKNKRTSKHAREFVLKN